MTLHVFTALVKTGSPSAVCAPAGVAGCPWIQAARELRAAAGAGSGPVSQSWAQSPGSAPRGLSLPGQAAPGPLLPAATSSLGSQQAPKITGTGFPHRAQQSLWCCRRSGDCRDPSQDTGHWCLLPTLGVASRPPLGPGSPSLRAGRPAGRRGWRELAGGRRLLPCTCSPP